MKRIPFWFSLLLTLLLVPSGQAEAGRIHPPANIATDADASNRMSLNGMWRFTLAADETAGERLRGFHQASFDTSNFRALPVPSNWAMHGFEEPSYSRRSGAEGFYVHSFRAPESLAGKRVVLHFDGVWASAEVWLNGELLDRHDSGFTGFAFDVTPQLKVGGENRLAVRVRQSLRDASLDANDDWSLGGIYRDVWLEAMPRNLYLDRIETATKFDEKFRDAVLNVNALIVRRGEHNAPNPDFELRAILTDRSGRETGRTSFKGGVTGPHRDNGREIHLRIPVSAAAHWTAETPNLYDLRVELLVNGQVTHTRTERIGFREISIVGNVLRVNGQAVKLRGVNRHDEHPDVGRATQREHWLEDIRLMKAANINSVRMSHYPPAEGFLKLCDEMGLYVLDEVAMGFGGERLNDPSYAAAVLLRTYETVARDRNRPSIIIWCIGNEDPFTELHRAAVRTVKGLDSTRPVLLPWRSEEELPPEVDILAPHYRSAEDYDRMASIARRPIITTEYTHALGADDFGGLDERWQALTKHASGAGGMIWLWADQGLRRKVRGRPVLDSLTDLGRYDEWGTELVGRKTGASDDEMYDARGIYGEDGIVNSDRSPQRDYWETKAVYAPVSLMAESLPLIAGQPSATISVRNDHDFTDFSAISLEWRLMMEERELDRGTARLNAAPHTVQPLPVPLSAIKNIEPGKAYYVHLTFRHKDGSNITNRSVRLINPATKPSDDGNGKRRAGTRPKVGTRGTLTTVSAGTARYGFDSRTGSLVSASLKNRPLITGSRVTVWRPLTLSEANRYRQAHTGRPAAADLNRYATIVKRFEVVKDKDGVRVEIETEHRVDERNNFTARCTYRINAVGGLRTEYEVKPQVEIEYLPEIGFEFDLASGLETLRWLGLGDLDSYPNKRAAAVFGAWSERAGAGHGIKSGVEWARLTDATTGGGLQITGSPYISFTRDEARGHNRLRVLSAVAGRFTKFSEPERIEQRHTTSPSRAFTGGFNFSLR